MFEKFDGSLSKMLLFSLEVSGTSKCIEWFVWLFFFLELQNFFKLLKRVLVISPAKRIARVLFLRAL